MSTTLRVHILAKELGVTSKAIIDKCEAEGISLKNHMAVISLGLAESIREWFSGRDDITSVESSAHVDIDAARVAARKARARHGRPDREGDESGGAAVATEDEGDDQSTELGGPQADAPASAPEIVAAPEPEPPAEAHPAAPAPAPAAPARAEPPPAIAAVAAPVIAPAPEPPPPPARAPVAPMSPGVLTPAASAPPPALEAPPPPPAAPAPAAPGPVPMPPPPPPPRRHAPPPASPPRDPVRPAGPQLVPKPATLQGPRVVRVEAPDPGPAARPRGPGGPGGGVYERSGGPPSSPSTGSPRRARGLGARREEDERNKAKAGRRHSESPVDVEARIREWRDQDLAERRERVASATGHGLRDRRAAERRRQTAPHQAPAPGGRKEAVTIVAPIALKDLCAAIGVPFVKISKKLMEQTGRLWTINQMLDAEAAELLALDLGIPLNVERAKSAYERLAEEFAERERAHLQPRPPVVAMLGHVDHGKTSLLDAIRSANVASGEAGGITQHIGAYRVQRNEWDVTFVDTPGHQAFTAMRARGANLTDVVVLVVAADDGVMPQTIEAINHAKAAGVAIVVALNKIDMPGVDVNRVYAQLSEHGLIPSEWGGTTDVVKTSATKGQGVADLVAHLSTLSELMDLKADATIPCMATVIEARMREGQGVVAQVLVREGTLKPGQFVVCGPAHGRVRALIDDRGRSIREAGPGSPVAVSGLDAVPMAGDSMYQVDSLSHAKEIADEVAQQRRAATLQVGTKVRSLDALVLGGETETPELNIIVKADVQGSVEVLRSALADFPAEKAKLKILHAAIGAISEADVHLAKASGAMVIGFHVVADDRARALADQLGVTLRYYRIIYEMIDDLHKALVGLLEPDRREEQRGTVEVRQVFNVSRVGTIAGCYVTDGVIARSHKIRLVRDGRIVAESLSIGSLKRFKDDAREVRTGFECGVKLDGYDDIKPGDVLQSFEVVESAQSL